MLVYYILTSGHMGAPMFSLRLILKVFFIVYWWDVVPLLFRLQTNVFGETHTQAWIRTLLPLNKVLFKKFFVLPSFFLRTTVRKGWSSTRSYCVLRTTQKSFGDHRRVWISLDRTTNKPLPLEVCAEVTAELFRRFHPSAASGASVRASDLGLSAIGQGSCGLF